MQPVDLFPVPVPAVELEGSLGRNGGSIAIANATLVQDADFCLWLETTTTSVTSSDIRDENRFRISKFFSIKAFGILKGVYLKAWQLSSFKDY